MNGKIGVALCCWMILSVGCGSSVSINHDYDPSYDFSALTTYAWLPIKAAPQMSELRIRRFVNAVDAQMQAKGIQLSTDNPSFLIAMHGSTQQAISVQDYGYSYGPGWGPRTRDVSVTSYEEGTVFVDLVDGETRQLFWRGIATGAAEPSLSPEQQERKFNDVAARLFANFPPRKR
ncbi:MAG: DUF4136 domain-containing protein [Candidatus Latescibacterota bacterium]|nr:MAG: DUF4136 domain-containing protein [Candidatus Latescibacterota bacterium]